ncbi:MAG: methylenetetrahydrofolate reductase, partial [Actinobacteria bacterium]|nr:methylenetetrahydrofolate reductase [Actinomycetota bacterium]
QAIESLGYPLPEIGVAAYPDGHPFISHETLRQALKNKQPHASYMTTQMCFDPIIISDWIADVRSDGITLPIHLGMPGVAPVRKLISIAAQIGVGDSARFLSRHRGLFGRLTRQSTYAPDRLANGLSQVIADPEANIGVVHLYTFNQVETSEAWRQDWLAAIDGSGKE